MLKDLGEKGQLIKTEQLKIVEKNQDINFLRSDIIDLTIHLKKLESLKVVSFWMWIRGWKKLSGSNDL